MADFQQTSRILVTCPKRTSFLLHDEIAALDLPIREEFVTGVETEGSLDDAMRINLHTRTGYHVHFLLATFSARDAEDLYRNVVAIEWERYIDEDGYLSITSSVDNPTIRNTLFANLKCKDAIVDRFRQVAGRRPDSGAERSGVVVFLYWRNDHCSIFLDTSGEPLSKRSYRKIPHRAPMQESLAAGVMLATRWRGDDNLVNPMCGSGTLAIEAALLGSNRPPGSLRSNFAFMHIKGFDPLRWEAIKKEARRDIRKKLGGRIIVSDRDEAAVVAARKNAIAAGVDHLMEFEVCDFRETTVPEGGGSVIMNPEYGERLGDEMKLEATYRGIGDFFKQKCGGYTGYVFTGNSFLAKQIGLKTKRKIPFFNTTIDCRLLEYELYQGSRRHEAAE